MFKIEKDSIITEMITPFGKASISCRKAGDKIDLTIDHAVIKKTITVSKEETEKGLKDLLKWIVE